MHSLLLSKPFFTHDTSSGQANIFDNDQQYLIEIEAPGFSTEDFNITATTNSIQIKAKRELIHPEGYSVQRQEARTTTINRQFRFRQTIDAEQIEASVSNGIISLKIPKKAAHSIEVKAT